MSTEEDIARAAGGESFVEELRTEHKRTGGYASQMSLRDHFAGLAMQGMLGYPRIDLTAEQRLNWAQTIASTSYHMADAMLERRKR